MMGIPLSPEERKALDEKIVARKAAVAESLAAHGISHDSCADYGHDHVPVAPVEVEEAGDIDEEAVLRYIRTRQEAIDKLRAQVHNLDGRIRHLESQLTLSEKKNAALRDALAKARESLKDIQDASEAQ